MSNYEIAEKLFMENKYEQSVKHYLLALNELDDDKEEKKYLYYTLGYMYSKGLGTEKNLQTAKNFLEKSVNLKCGFATFYLGKMLWEDILHKNTNEDKETYKKAKELIQAVHIAGTKDYIDMSSEILIDMAFHEFGLLKD